jgi:DNA-binding response OmpR family regulator
LPNVNTPVLVIDNDLEFAFWLARALDCAGYQAFPANTLQDASILLSEIPLNLGLLVLTGTPSEADPFLARLRRQHRDLRVVSLLEDDEADDPAFLVDTHIQKPTGRTQYDLAEILAVIDRMLASEPVTH